MLPEDFDDEQEDHHGALALEFFQSSYEHYLATGTEDHLAQVEQLRDRYGRLLFRACLLLWFLILTCL
jgi:hypothetical protein